MVVPGLAIAGALASCAGGSPATDRPSAISSSAAAGRTHGPNGETGAPASGLRLTPADVAKLRAGRYTAALVWH
jgi:hypothetical protein